MYVITISHSYSQDGYYLPEKKVTGRNSYRAYKSISKADDSMKKLFEFYKTYLETHKKETIIIKNSVILTNYQKIKMYILYYRYGEFMYDTVEL